jgi:hypothetical protein
MRTAGSQAKAIPQRHGERCLSNCRWAAEKVARAANIASPAPETLSLSRQQISDVDSLDGMKCRREMGELGRGYQGVMDDDQVVGQRRSAKASLNGHKRPCHVTAEYTARFPASGRRSISLT